MPVKIKCPICEAEEASSCCVEISHKTISKNVNEYYDDNGDRHYHGSRTIKRVMRCDRDHLFTACEIINHSCRPCDIKPSRTVEYSNITDAE